MGAFARHRQMRAFQMQARDASARLAGGPPPRAATAAAVRAGASVISVGNSASVPSPAWACAIRSSTATSGAELNSNLAAAIHLKINKSGRDSAPR